MRNGQSERRMHGAFIYPRFSTDNQHADSIEVQVERCTEYCARNGLDVLGVYPDYAVSGMKTSRPQYDKMMADLRAGMADTVVVYDQSRLFRDMPAWFSFRDELKNIGVRVISVTQPFVGGDILDPNVFMLEASNAMINHMWVLATRQKVVAKMRYMALHGQHTGGKPALGYKVVDKRLEIDEAEADTVRRIFKEYAAGASYKSIIDGLNADGIRTKRGQPFGNNSLHDLLKNELYIGVKIYGAKPYRADGSRNTHAADGTDVIRIENAVPAIVDNFTFNEVQKRMAINRRVQGGRPASAREYPLKGKVFCGNCGSAMTVATAKKKQYTYYYYRCAKKDRTHDCDSHPIRCDELEDVVVQQVRAMIGNPDIRRSALEFLRAETDKLTRTGELQYLQLQRNEQELDAQISRIVDAIAAGAYSAALNARLSSLEDQKKAVQAKMNELRHMAEVAALPSERLEALFDQICTISQKDSSTILSIVSRVVVYDDTIKVYTVFDPNPEKTHFDHTTEPIAEVAKTLGIPSGVPRVIITGNGLGFIIARHR